MFAEGRTQRGDAQGKAQTEEVSELGWFFHSGCSHLKLCTDGYVPSKDMQWKENLVSKINVY